MLMQLPWPPTLGPSVGKGSDGTGLEFELRLTPDFRSLSLGLAEAEQCVRFAEGDTLPNKAAPASYGVSL